MAEQTTMERSLTVEIELPSLVDPDRDQAIRCALEAVLTHLPDRLGGLGKLRSFEIRLFEIPCVIGDIAQREDVEPTGVSVDYEISCRRSSGGHVGKVGDGTLWAGSYREAVRPLAEVMQEQVDRLRSPAGITVKVDVTEGVRREQFESDLGLAPSDVVRSKGEPVGVWSPRRSRGQRARTVEDEDGREAGDVDHGGRARGCEHG